MLWISLKIFGGKLAPKLVCFVPKKELLNLNETELWSEVEIVVIISKHEWKFPVAEILTSLTKHEQKSS